CPVRGTVLTAREPVPTVALASVTHRYGGTAALTEVDLVLGSGTTVLLGRNGAGKSTLCRILTGLLPPTSGQVEREGRALTTAADWRWHHGATGWLPQSPAVPGSMTVQQYLRYAAWLKGIGRRSVQEAVDTAIRDADLVLQRDQRLKALSGGMLRRVGIAQAVAHRPSLVVLDEPTVGLDPEQRAAFHQLIRDLSADRAVLLSTHLLEDASAVADRVVVLDQGRVRFDGSLEELSRLSPEPLPAGSEAVRAGFIAVVNGAVT
ncbi:MAG: ABC transporter ATP-binding protein, partial [Marmoricola sp.]